MIGSSIQPVDGPGAILGHEHLALPGAVDEVAADELAHIPASHDPPGHAPRVASLFPSRDLVRIHANLGNLLAIGKPLGQRHSARV